MNAQNLCGGTILREGFLPIPHHSYRNILTIHACTHLHPQKKSPPTHTHTHEGQDQMGLDRIGWDGMGNDGLGWGRIEQDRIGFNGVGWNEPEKDKTE